MMCLEAKTDYVVFASCECLIREDQHGCEDCMHKWLVEWPQRQCLYCGIDFDNAFKANVSKLVGVLKKTENVFTIPSAPVRPPDEIYFDTLVQEGEEAAVVFHNDGVRVRADGEILSDGEEDDGDASDVDEDGNLLGFIDDSGEEGYASDDDEALLFTRRHALLMERCV